MFEIRLLGPGRPGPGLGSLPRAPNTGARASDRQVVAILDLGILESVEFATDRGPGPGAGARGPGAGPGGRDHPALLASNRGGNWSKQLLPSVAKGGGPGPGPGAGARRAREPPQDLGRIGGIGSHLVSSKAVVIGPMFDLFDLFQSNV